MQNKTSLWPTGSCTVIRWCLIVAVAGSPPALFGQSKSDNPDSQPTALSSLLKTFHKEFVAIMPGKGRFPAKFQMGSKAGGTIAKKNEGPVHEVTMKRPFAIARYEIPQNLYEAVMGSNPSRWKGKRNSVEMVSWKDATRFCERVTQLMRTEKLIQADEVIRLPTESEWEYSCRAGTTTEFSFGDNATKQGDMGNMASKLDPYAWHTGNAAGNDPAVGALKPNPWGLYDMHGYLWEYVQDGYQADYSKTPTDGSAAKGGDNRVVRGGSWQGNYSTLRSASRMKVPETIKDPGIGFRCVKSKLQ